MKLEYFHNGFTNYPLIRLYEFTPGEAEDLLTAITSLASGTIDQVEVHLLPFVEPMGKCCLTLVHRPWDQGITKLSEKAEFECGLTLGSWDNIAGLVEPFAKGVSGFQWVTGVPGEAVLLSSSTGNW